MLSASVKAFLRLFFLISMMAITGWAKAQEGESAELVYVEITPSFVTNYDRGARLKYLKANVALRVQAEGEYIVRKHLPYLQNSLVMLFSAQAEENLTSTMSREVLRREALDEIKRSLSVLQSGGDMLVADLYFTDFVVQQ